MLRIKRARYKPQRFLKIGRRYHNFMPLYKKWGKINTFLEKYI